MPWWFALTLTIGVALSPLALVTYLKLRPYRSYSSFVPLESERVIESDWAVLYLDGARIGQHSKIWLTNLRLYISPSRGGLGEVERPVSLPLALISDLAREKLRPLDLGRLIPMKVEWRDPNLGTERSMHLQISDGMIPMPWSISTSRFFAKLQDEFRRTAPSRRNGAEVTNLRM